MDLDYYEACREYGGLVLVTRTPPGFEVDFSGG